MLSFGTIKGSFKWFTSYLNDKTQKVKINDIVKNDKIINCGVSQGSALGPILFVMHIISIMQYEN